MADRLTMSKPEALQVASTIKQISQDNANAIIALERANARLRSGWDADAQRAYEECFLQMKSKLNTYTELLAEYSDTLTRVANGTFATDTEYANNIRAKFGGLNLDCRSLCRNIALHLHINFCFPIIN